MRTALLLSTFIGLTACSDNPQPTALHSIDSGTTVVGGGFSIGAGYVVAIVDSEDDNQNGWVVRVHSPPTTPEVFNFHAIAYCLS